MGFMIDNEEKVLGKMEDEGRFRSRDRNDKGPLNCCAVGVW